MNLLRLDKNTKGRDFVIGDIHGCFTAVKEWLDKLNFDKSCDRLISVGDLVDRGAESHHVLEWLDYDWFFAVRGNHEDMAIRFPNGNMDEFNYARNGGLWFISLPRDEQLRISEALSYLPMAIEVDTDMGVVGVIHAEVPGNDWSRITEDMDRRAKSQCMWSRDKIESMNDKPVANISRVIVGHTPLTSPVQLGNVTYIDTAGWHVSGDFSILQIQ